MITEIYFFDDASLLNKCRIEALKNKKNTTKVIVDKVTEFIQKKFNENPRFRSNDEFYLMCRQYADRMNMRIATFVEHACRETIK